MGNLLQRNHIAPVPNSNSNTIEYFTIALAIAIQFSLLLLGIGFLKIDYCYWVLGTIIFFSTDSSVALNLVNL